MHISSPKQILPDEIINGSEDEVGLARATFRLRSVVENILESNKATLTKDYERYFKAKYFNFKAYKCKRDFYEQIFGVYKVHIYTIFSQKTVAVLKETCREIRKRHPILARNAIVLSASKTAIIDSICKFVGLLPYDDVHLSTRVASLEPKRKKRKKKKKNCKSCADPDDLLLEDAKPAPSPQNLTQTDQIRATITSAGEGSFTNADIEVAIATAQLHTYLAQDFLDPFKSARKPLDIASLKACATNFLAFLETMSPAPNPANTTISAQTLSQEHSSSLNTTKQ